MMQVRNLVNTFKRYETLLFHKVKALPIVILMPHSACNCRCVMCDIWKGNKNAKQLSEQDVQNVLSSLKRLHTKRVLMSGGEALLNKNFFHFCDIIREQGVKITLLSTGMTVERNAEKIIEKVDELIVSVDGDEQLHNEIRNIPGAFEALRSGLEKVKRLDSGFPISARCVIHRLNFKKWSSIVAAAKTLPIDRISFLPADVTSNAFNREEAWNDEKQENILIPKEELELLRATIEELHITFRNEFENKFISESYQDLLKFHTYYSAHYGLVPFPIKKCNAPWVSVVVEADGTVRPCFFHDEIGSIKTDHLADIINKPEVVTYRKKLDVTKNETCQKCVCYLNLQPRNNHY